MRPVPASGIGPAEHAIATEGMPEPKPDGRVRLGIRKKLEASMAEELQGKRIVRA
jgi:hypothetical protein